MKQDMTASWEHMSFRFTDISLPLALLLRKQRLLLLKHHYVTQQPSMTSKLIASKS